MSRRVKELLSHEIRSVYAETQGGVIVDLAGLDAIAAHELRGELRERSIALRVLRNKLAKRAFAGLPLQPLCPHLVGPCALVTGESAVDVARALVELAKRYPAVELKAGLVEGDTQCREGAVIARLKPLSQLRGELAMAFRSPAGRIAACLRAPGGIIAACVKAIIAKCEGSAASAA